MPPSHESAQGMPSWIPDRVARVLRTTLERETIDLDSPASIGTHFVNEREVKDLYDVIHQIEEPVLVGLLGSRAFLDRPPLFRNEAEFDAYHRARAEEFGGFERYLRRDEAGFSPLEYEQARAYLNGGFNQQYAAGRRYPQPIVNALVRDIDLLVISNGRHPLESSHTGRRTNVTIETTFNSPFKPFEDDPEDLRAYLERGLTNVVPLKYAARL